MPPRGRDAANSAAPLAQDVIRIKKTMKLFIKASILIVLLATGCTSEKQDWSEFSTYDKAIDIDNYVFPNGVANQVYFKVKAQYPNTDVLNFYKTTITSPWVECTESNDWQSFGDISGNEPLFIHQTAQRWVNREKNRLLLFAIKYRSQGSESRKMPDNNIQNVYLVEYVQPNIDDAISDLGITCNGV